MKNTLIALSLLLASCQTQTAGNIKLLGGVRDFQDSSDWEQTDDQTNVLGIGLDLAGKDGFGPEIGYTYSQDVSYDDTYVNRKVNDTKSRVSEIYLGLRKNYMVNDWWQVSFSGGMSSLNVETSVNLSYSGDTATDRGRAYAPYINIGTSVFVIDNLFIGIEYRHNFLNEDVDIFILDPELDCDMYLLSIGFSF